MQEYIKNNGGCSDDGFEYFRCWLIGLGKDKFEQALQNPESITEFTDPDCDFYENEQLLYAGMAAYEQVAGEEMPARNNDSGGSDPKGVPLSEDDVYSLFPKACEKYYSE